MLHGSNPARFKWLVDPPTDVGLRQYVSARRHPVVSGIGEWGDHAEIIVMEELFDRPIEIFSVKDGASPRKTHLDGEMPESMHGVTPIRISYHGENHYNSVVSDAGVDYEPFPLPPRGTKVLQQFRRSMM